MGDGFKRIQQARTAWPLKAIAKSLSCPLRKLCFMDVKLFIFYAFARTLKKNILVDPFASWSLEINFKRSVMVSFGVSALWWNGNLFDRTWSENEWSILPGLFAFWKSCCLICANIWNIAHFNKMALQLTKLNCEACGEAKGRHFEHFV